MFNQVTRVISPMEKCIFRSSSTFNMKKFNLPCRYKDSKTVWQEYAYLANKYRPVVLGNGYPDFSAPKLVTQTLIDVAQDQDIKLQMTARSNGHPRLTTTLAHLYTKLTNNPIDPIHEIIITCGAHEAMYCCIHGNVEYGDEVIIIEPIFDGIAPIVRSAGGKPVFIPIRPKNDASNAANWVLDDVELKFAFNKKTKAIIISTPNNPTGKVFTKEELKRIAELCNKWDVICISDESYEWFVIPPNKHERICSLPTMWEKTLTIGSAGKSLGVTGWKTGWAYGPIHLMRNVFYVHQNCVLTHCTPIQEAIARIFDAVLSKIGTVDCFFAKGPPMLKKKLDFMVDAFKKVNLKPVRPHGSFYFITDWTRTENRCNFLEEKDKYMDYKFTKWMIKNVGVQFIPVSAFLSTKNKKIGENYFRTCVMKKDETLKSAANKLNAWKQKAIEELLE